MKKRYLLPLFVCIMLSSVLGNHVSGQATTVKLEGVVVAHDQKLISNLCFDGVCDGSLIVRLSNTKESKATYVLIDFSYSVRKPPYGSLDVKKKFEFTVLRTEYNDRPLREFFPRRPRLVEGSIKEDDSTVPMWRFVRGAENEKLPYGEVIPSYKLERKLTKNIGPKI
jgi:hypothetical protein